MCTFVDKGEGFPIVYVYNFPSDAQIGQFFSDITNNLCVNFVNFPVFPQYHLNIENKNKNISRKYNGEFLFREGGGGAKSVHHFKDGL